MDLNIAFLIDPNEVSSVEFKSHPESDFVEVKFNQDETTVIMTMAKTQWLSFGYELKEFLGIMWRED